MEDGILLTDELFEDRLMWRLKDYYFVDVLEGGLRIGWKDGAIWVEGGKTKIKYLHELEQLYYVLTGYYLPIL